MPVEQHDSSLLSYIAVAGIILLSPYLNIGNLFNIHNRIVRYVTGLIAASLAAQIATIPLATYYFHYIPMWGLLSNLLLTPLLTPLVFMALIMQLCEASNLPHAWIDHATDTTARLLCNGANTIATLCLYVFKSTRRLSFGGRRRLARLRRGRG